LVDPPVELKPRLGVSGGLDLEAEDRFGRSHPEADSEAGKVGERVSEGTQLPVEKDRRIGVTDQMSWLKVVVDKPWFDVRRHRIDGGMKHFGFAGQVRRRGGVRDEAIVEVVAPAVMATGGGEAPKVGAGDAVDTVKRFGDFLQQAVGGYRNGGHSVLGGPRWCRFGVGVEQPGGGGLMAREELQGGGLVGGAGWVAVVLEHVGASSVDQPDAVGMPGGDLGGAGGYGATE
jgi:hypothetical protein